MTFQSALKHYKIQFGTVLILLAVLYIRIIPSMIQQWYEDGNYSHGFIVPLIAGYFLYTHWEELKNAPVEVCNLGIAVFLCGLLQLLAGWAATEYFTMRSSLIVLLAGLVLFLFGKRIFRIVSLPLLYLYFMIPIPYIIYDAIAFPLKLFVTKVSVIILKIIGVVVVREGNIIMFPATTLEVADACSGIRSLLSLLAFAAAFAFFLRIAPWKRLVLIFSAIPIAIFTNSIRVIMTGILAQWWGGNAAKGFFHEFAGVAVFVLAMIILFALSTLLGKKNTYEVLITGTSAQELIFSPTQKNKRPGFYSFIMIYTGMIAIGLFINFHNDIYVPANRPFQEFPTQVKSWEMTSGETFSDSVLAVLKPTDYISRRYKDSEGNAVNFYIGYHGGGKGAGEIHSPKHCLPGSGWYEIDTKNIVLDTVNGPIKLVQGTYQKGTNKELFLYWYHVRNKTFSNEYALKVTQIINSIFSRRRDASFIRISMPFNESDKKVETISKQFVRDFVPVINDFLPK